MPLIQNAQSLLVTGTPVVASLTGISTYAVTHPSAGQFFFAGGGGANGDLVIATGRHQNAVGQIPSVFTPLLVSALDGTMWAGYAIIGAAAQGSAQNLPSGATNWVIHQVVYRPDIPISLVTPTTQAISGPTDAQPSNVVIPETSSPSLAYAYFQSSGALSGAIMTPTHDGQMNAGISNVAMSFRANNGSAATVTCSMNDSGSSNAIIAGAVSVF